MAQENGHVHTHNQDHVHGGDQGDVRSHSEQGHTHQDGHRHDHGAPTSGWRYTVAIGLNILIVIGQVVAGLWLDSTALIADAGHNLSDVLGLIMAGVAAWFMAQEPTARRTYGYGKAGILAAFLNSLLLVFAAGALAYAAITRLINPPLEAPAGLGVMLVAGLGAMVNLGTGWLLMSGHPDDVNRRAAVVHLMADAGVSLGVVAAGAGMMWLGWRWIDPAASLLIVVVILISTWRILVQSLNMALDAAPDSIDPTRVRGWLLGQHGIESVHDLHIWPISATQTALTVHLLVPNENTQTVLQQIQSGLKAEFGIGHATIQIERTMCDTQSEELHA